MRKIHTPLNEDITKKLKAGDSILLSGTIFIPYIQQGMLLMKD